jgi:hypothetical protein
MTTFTSEQRATMAAPHFNGADVMLAKIMNVFKSNWHRLTGHTNARRLSWFAVMLLFALDGYVLTLLFDGARNAGRMIDYVEHRVSPACAKTSEQLLKDKLDDQANTIALFADDFGKDRNAVSLEFNNNHGEIAPICVSIRDKWIAALSAAMPQLLSLANERSEQFEQSRQIERAIDRLKSSYSDALLEKVAGQSREDSILPAEASQVKGKLKTLDATLADLREKHQAAAYAMVQQPAIAAYLHYLQTLPLQAEFTKENELYAHRQFWYPVKVIAAQAAFLIPLLLAAIFWNKRAIRKQQATSILVSSHMILACALPILLRLLDVLRDLLPRQLLYFLLDKLDQWQLLFIWDYALILACIAGGLLLIFIAQRTLFSAARMRLIRLRKAQCQACGEKLLTRDQNWCEVCGASQAKPCRQCGQPRRLLAFHCSHCGTPV